MSKDSEPDPSTEDFLVNGDNYKPWAYREGWEARFAQVLLAELKLIDQGHKSLPAACKLNVKLFKELLEILNRGLREGSSFTPSDALTYFGLGNVQKMFDEFGYSPEVVQEINFIGDYFHKSKAKDIERKYSELVNKKRFDETGKLVYWVNPNRGEPNNELTDHSVILWEYYTAPAPSKLKITIKSINGKNLAKKDIKNGETNEKWHIRHKTTHKSGKSDPYVEIGQRTNDKWHLLHKTSMIKKELNPSWPSLNAKIEVDTSVPLIFVVNDWDLIGHDFMGTWEVDLRVLQFLQEKHKKDEITVLQRFSGLKRSEKIVDWAPIVTGVLEITFAFH